MNKKLLFLLPLLGLTACGDRQIKMLVPTGAPAVAFYNHSLDDNFFTNSVPTNIVSKMTSNSEFDAIVVDTTSGIKAIKNGANFKIAATITFGNFFLAGTGNDVNKTLDYTDSVALFGPINGIPTLLFDYIYDISKFTNIIRVDAVTDAKRILDTKKMIDNTPVDYVFIAQPALFASLKSNTDAYVYDNFQTKYKEKSGDSMITQASLFLKNNVQRDKAEFFLNSLEEDINNAVSNPNLIKEGMDKIEDKALASQIYGVSSDVAKAVTAQNNGMGLGFKRAIDIKNDIDLFITILGMEATDEEIYYK